VDTGKSSKGCRFHDCKSGHPRRAIGHIINAAESSDLDALAKGRPTDLIIHVLLNRAIRRLTTF
jgi:hypothetical protein